jgi:translation initiation factor IF-2
VGNYVAAGTTWAKVKGMVNDHGVAVTSSGPSMAVEVVGWKELPITGDPVSGCESEVSHRRIESLF